jgi:hypothetical protein
LHREGSAADGYKFAAMAAQSRAEQREEEEEGEKGLRYVQEASRLRMGRRKQEILEGARGKSVREERATLRPCRKRNCQEALEMVAQYYTVRGWFKGMDWKTTMSANGDFSSGT